MKKFFKDNKMIILCITLSIAFIAVVGSFAISKLNNNKASSLNSSELPPSYKGVEENKNSSLKNQITLEIGSELPVITDYFEDSSDVNADAIIKYYYNDIEISETSFTSTKDDKMYLKTANTYKVLIIDGDKEYTTSLKIVDTVAPTVVLKNVSITEGDKYSVKDFLSSYSDNSGSNSYTISFKDNNYANFKNIGTYTVVITVCDQHKNCVDKTGSLTINEFVLKVVKTIEQEIVVKTEEIKYGVRKITKAKVTYDVYNDGSKKEVSRKAETFTIDQSTYNGTVAAMKSEASSIYNSLSTTRNTILTTTNKYRTEKNVNGLTLDATLSIMATIRAMEMAYSGEFSHERPDGREWSTMWDDYLGETPGGLTIGENLAYGYSSDEGACQGWRDSEGHYENMINASFTKMGVGKYTFNGKTYWAQLFQS